MPVETQFRLGSLAKPVVFVPVLIIGKGPYQFALDTGALQTVLSYELADELALDQGKEDVGLGAGGKVSVSASRVGSMCRVCQARGPPGGCN